MILKRLNHVSSYAVVVNIDPYAVPDGEGVAPVITVAKYTGDESTDGEWNPAHINYRAGHQLNRWQVSFMRDAMYDASIIAGILDQLLEGGEEIEDTAAFIEQFEAELLAHRVDGLTTV